MAQFNKTVDPIIVDAILLSRQREWESLLDEKEISNPTAPALQLCDPLFDPDKRVASLYWLTPKQRSLLQRTWMRSAIQGRPIFYPNNANDLYVYIFRESPLYHTFILITLVTMFVAPLFQPAYCLRDHGYSQARLTWQIFTLICICVQLFDVYLCGKSCHLASRRNNIANHVHGDSTLSWMKIRIVCCLIIGINSILGLSAVTVPSFSLALVPVLFLVTRHHLRQLAEGIFHAFLQIARFPKIWVIFLISWSFMGYCILRRYTALPAGSEVHFGSFQQSIYANFHCMLSRPTVLYRLRTVFEQNNYISFYFVALTVFGDILLTTLVIALGNRAFRNFSARTLNQGLRYRYIAARALFLLYAKPSLKYVVSQEQMHINRKEEPTADVDKNNDNRDKEISIQSWLLFCQDASPTLMTSNIDERRLLFASEILSDERYTLQETGLNQAGFFRLLGAMTMTLRMKFRPQQRAILLEKLQQRLFSACVHSLVGLGEDITPYIKDSSSSSVLSTKSFAFSNTILEDIPLQQLSPRNDKSLPLQKFSPIDDRNLLQPKLSPRDDLVKLSPRDTYLEKLSPREETSSFVVVAQNSNLTRDVTMIRPIDITSSTQSQSITQRYTITSPSLHSMYIDGNPLTAINTSNNASTANEAARPSDWQHRWSEFVTQVSDVNELDVFSPERAAQLAIDFFRQRVTYVFGTSQKDPTVNANRANAVHNDGRSITTMPDHTISSNHSLSIEEQRNFNVQASLENALEDYSLPQYRRYYLYCLLFCRTSYFSTFDISYYPTNFYRKLKVISSPTSLKYQQNTAKLPWIDTNRVKILTLRYFRLFTWMVNILVIISTFLLARRNVSSAAIPLLWLVFFGALGRDVVRIVVRETHLTRLRWDVSINFVFFILLCNLGSKLHHLNQTDETLLMVLQTLRCVLLLWRLPCFSLFREIFPVVYRTVVVFAMVVYGFAVLGHITFCQVLQSDSLPPTDDDTSSWLPFASFIHFNSFASSLYTVSIVAVLSNWSMVMDAAVVMSAYHTEKAWTYFYFYALRISLTLTIIPLLLSSIMQSFVQRLKLQREKQAMKKQAKRQAAARNSTKIMSALQQKQIELEKSRAQQENEREMADADKLDNKGIQMLTKTIDGQKYLPRDSGVSVSSELSERNTNFSTDEFGNKHYTKAVKDVDFFNFIGEGVTLGDSDNDEDEEAEEDLHVAYSPIAIHKKVKLFVAEDMHVNNGNEGLTLTQSNLQNQTKGNEQDEQETENEEEDEEEEEKEEEEKENADLAARDPQQNDKPKKQKRKSRIETIRADGVSMMSTASDIVLSNQRQGFEKQIHSQMSRQMQLQRLKGTQILCREDRLDALAALWSSTGRALWEKKRLAPYEAEEKEVCEIVKQTEILTEQWLDYIPMLMKYMNSMNAPCESDAGMNDQNKKKDKQFDRFEIVHSLIVRYQRRFWQSFQANEALFHVSHPSIKNYHPSVTNPSINNKEILTLPGYFINSHFFVHDRANPHLSTHNFFDKPIPNPSNTRDRHYPLIMSDLLQESRLALSRSQRIHLACQWLRDAASGRTLTYPVTNGQLRSLLIHRSLLTTYILYAVALLQMVSIFFIVPFCIGNDNVNLNNSANNYVSRRVLNIFDLLCALVYIVELVLDVHARYSLYMRWSWWTQTKRWLLLRTCFVALILANSLPPLIDFHSSDSIIKGHFRLVRALFPVLLIARDEGLGDITRGLFRSARRTFPVYMFLITLLLLFAMSGYWLFHRFETNADRFASLSTSFLTILQSATAAPFSLFVITPYYDISVWTPLFFLLLTYVSELLCISLIVGAGTVLFASYAEKTMTHRRLQMHQMIQATFVLLLTPSTAVQSEKGKDTEDVALCLKEEDCIVLCHSFVSQAYWWLPPWDTTHNDTATPNTEKSFDTFDGLLRYAKRNRDLDHNTINNDKNAAQDDATVTRQEFSELLMLVFEGVECRRVSRHKLPPKNMDKETITQIAPEDTVKDVSSPLHPFQDTHTEKNHVDSNKQMSNDTSVHRTHPMKLSGIQRRISQLQLQAQVQLHLQELPPTCNNALEELQENEVDTEKEEEEEAEKDENETDAEVVQHYHEKRRSWTQNNKRQSLSQYEQQQMDLKRLSLQYNDKPFKTQVGANQQKNVDANSSIKYDSEHEEIIEVYIKHRYTSLLPLWFPWLLLTSSGATIKSAKDADKSNTPYNPNISNNDSQSFDRNNRGIFLVGVPLWLQILWEGKDFCDRLCCTFLVTQRSRVSLLDMISMVAHVFLTAQLLMITSSNQVSVGWINLGYFLEVVFWCEMCIRIISYGEVRYLSDSIAVIRTCINIASLATMCLVSRADYNFSSETGEGTSTALISLVAIQCLRLTLVFLRLRGNGRFASAIASTSRALFLLALTLYFFTIFAQDRFCSILRPENIAGDVQDNDDAASGWNNFSNILVCSNYAQTLFTLFEVTVLGSWSMVMDAAASISSSDNNNVNPSLSTTSTYPTLFNKVVQGLISVTSSSNSTSTEGTNVNLDSIKPASSYVFFFTFRLFMTLLVLPLLVSYMVRSYVALLDQINFIHVARQKRRLLPLATVHNIDNGNNHNKINATENSTGTNPPIAAVEAVSVSPRDIAYAKTKEGLFPPSSTAPMSMDDEASSCFPWMFKLVSRVKRLYRAWRHNVLFKFVPLAPETWRYELGFLDIWDVHSLRQTDIVRLYGKQEDYALRVAENVRLELLAWYGQCAATYKSTRLDLFVPEVEHLDTIDNNTNDSYNNMNILLRDVRETLLQSDLIDPSYR